MAQACTKCERPLSQGADATSAALFACGHKYHLGCVDDPGNLNECPECKFWGRVKTGVIVGLVAIPIIWCLFSGRSGAPESAREHVRSQGFGPKGPIKGTAAAFEHSKPGKIAAGSKFAQKQSIGMGGDILVSHYVEEATWGALKGTK
ncbi:hypothetical protein DAEQUDRAFT_758835 [Daedalea quercina L-15889]|uniref:RING-type domain-containing protein n=1 Tax=Daedalea quercina L-15889 TaxID=1314783 RepID=A0A165MZS2_9APHY|nr:hypothetical protein DAEQUDRAFT_758835 [Daedalea quercina L-15889]